MFVPYQKLSEDVISLFLAAFADDRVKEALSERIRIEIDTQRTKYNGDRQSYNSLTSGTVNLQTRMAASGYDVYGRVMLDADRSAENVNAYKKMKNQIHYGRNPETAPYTNRGSYRRA